MNLKKTIAGILASVVAVSAMATMAVSATNSIIHTADQKAYTKTWDFTGNKYPITWTGVASASPALTAAATAGEVTFTFDSDVDTAALKLTGLKEGTNNITKVVTLKQGADKKTYTLTLVNGVATNSAGALDVNTFIDGKLDMELSYTISDAKSTKALADAAAKVAKTVNVTTATTIADGIGKLVADSMSGKAIVAAEGKVAAAEKTHGPVLAGNPNTLYTIKGGDIAASTAIATGATSIADLKTFGFQNLALAIQNEIADAKGATLTFNLNVAAKTEDEKVPGSINPDTTAPLASSADAQNFALALNYSASQKFTAGQKVASDATKITFNWDDITKGLAAGTIFEMAIRVADSKAFQIDSIVVDVPAKTLGDLSAGQPTEDDATAVTTAAETTTAPVTNPTTGNAPIALAVIPVALVAAAIVAKKRG